MRVSDCGRTGNKYVEDTKSNKHLYIHRNSNTPYWVIRLPNGYIRPDGKYEHNDYKEAITEAKRILKVVTNG